MPNPDFQPEHFLVGQVIQKLLLKHFPLGTPYGIVADTEGNWTGLVLRRYGRLFRLRLEDLGDDQELAGGTLHNTLADDNKGECTLLDEGETLAYLQDGSSGYDAQSLDGEYWSWTRDYSR